MLTVIWIGALAGLIHFLLTGLLYGNPLVDRMYADAQNHEPGVRKWPCKRNYLIA